EQQQQPISHPPPLAKEGSLITVRPATSSSSFHIISESTSRPQTSDVSFKADSRPPLPLVSAADAPLRDNPDASTSSHDSAPPHARVAVSYQPRQSPHISPADMVGRIFQKRSSFSHIIVPMGDEDEIKSHAVDGRCSSSASQCAFQPTRNSTSRIDSSPSSLHPAAYISTFPSHTTTTLSTLPLELKEQIFILASNPSLALVDRTFYYAISRSNWIKAEWLMQRYGAEFVMAGCWRWRFMRRVVVRWDHGGGRGAESDMMMSERFEVGGTNQCEEGTDSGSVIVSIRDGGAFGGKQADPFVGAVANSGGGAGWGGWGKTKGKGKCHCAPTVVGKKRKHSSSPPTSYTSSRHYSKPPPLRRQSCSGKSTSEEQITGVRETKGKLKVKEGGHDNSSLFGAWFSLTVGRSNASTSSVVGTNQKILSSSVMAESELQPQTNPKDIKINIDGRNARSHSEGGMTNNNIDGVDGDHGGDGRSGGLLERLFRPARLRWKSFKERRRFYGARAGSATERRIWAGKGVEGSESGISPKGMGLKAVRRGGSSTVPAYPYSTHLVQSTEDDHDDDDESDPDLLPQILARIPCPLQRTQMEIVLNLLELGADVRAGYNMALRMAARWGHLNLAELVLIAGGDPDAGVPMKKGFFGRRRRRLGGNDVFELGTLDVGGGANGDGQPPVLITVADPQAGTDPTNPANPPPLAAPAVPAVNGAAPPQTQVPQIQAPPMQQLVAPPQPIWWWQRPRQPQHVSLLMQAVEGNHLELAELLVSPRVVPARKGDLIPPPRSSSLPQGSQQPQGAVATNAATSQATGTPALPPVDTSNYLVGDSLDDSKLLLLYPNSHLNIVSPPEYLSFPQSQPVQSHPVGQLLSKSTALTSLSKSQLRISRVSKRTLTSALGMAVSKGFMDMARLLVEKGGARPTWFMTQELLATASIWRLLTGTQDAYAPLLCLLIRNLPPQDFARHQGTLVRTCSEIGSVDAMKVCVERGGDVNVWDGLPLYASVYSGNVEITRYLVEDPDGPRATTDYFTWKQRGFCIGLMVVEGFALLMFAVLISIWAYGLGQAARYSDYGNQTGNNGGYNGTNGTFGGMNGTYTGTNSTYPGTNGTIVGNATTPQNRPSSRSTYDFDEASAIGELMGMAVPSLLALMIMYRLVPFHRLFKAYRIVVKEDEKRRRARRQSPQQQSAQQQEV
ncbi:hypothetical protein HK102_000691, partial [Quaeritorhiza haematococci]